MNELDIISRFTCWLYNYQVLNAAQMLGYLYFILSSAASSYPIKHQNDKGFSFIHLDLCKNLIIIHLLIFFSKTKTIFRNFSHAAFNILFYCKNRSILYKYNILASWYFKFSN